MGPTYIALGGYLYYINLLKYNGLLFRWKEKIFDFGENDGFNLR